jgi:hypothetical protein
MRGSRRLTTMTPEAASAPGQHALIAGARRVDHAGMDDLCSARVAADDRQVARARGAGSLASSFLAKLAGEVPGTQVTGSQANEEVVARVARIRGSGLTAEVAGRDALHYVLDSCGTEPGSAADLDSAAGRGVFADYDAYPRISPQMRGLHVAATGDDVEAAVAPSVPDRGQEHGAISPLRGQNRQHRSSARSPRPSIARSLRMRAG